MLRWHPAFQGKASAAAYKTELDAMRLNGYTLETWPGLPRSERAMLVAAVIIYRAFDALRAHDRETEAKAKRR